MIECKVLQRKVEFCLQKKSVDVDIEKYQGHD